MVPRLRMLGHVGHLLSIQAGGVHTARGDSDHILGICKCAGDQVSGMVAVWTNACCWKL